MSLVVWSTLNGGVENQGTAHITFSALSGALSPNATGKVTRYCYQNTSYTNGGYVSNEQITLGQNQSIFAWVKFTNLTSDSSLGGSIAGQHRYPTNVGMGLTIKYVSSTTGYLSVNTGNGSSRTFNTYCGSTLLQANTWYHLGYTYDGSTIRLYVNGNLDGSHAYSGMSTPTDYFMIGCWSFSASSGNGVYGGYKLYGYINDVRAYNHTLSKKEVKDLAKGLTLCYKCNFEDLYQPVEYIQSSGTQWIQTGLMSSDFSSKIIKCDISFYNNADSSRAYSTIIGCQQNLVTLLRIDSGTMKYFSNNSSQAYSGSVSRYNDYTVSYTTNYNNNTTSITVNGTTTSASSTASWGTNTVGIMLLASHNGGSPWTDELGLCRIYYCKFYDDDKLVRNFMPCVRKSDSKAGLYDLVNNVFYANSGTGEFSYPSTGISDIIDCSGYSNTGTSVNLTPTSSAIGNGAIRFNGSSSYLYRDIYLSDTMTFACWLKFNSTGSYHIIDCRAQSGETGYQPMYGGTGYGLQCYSSAGGSYTWSAETCGFSANVWYHIAVVITASNATLYINGVSKGTQSGTFGSNFGIRQMRLGTRCSGANWFNGDMSDIRVYATALSASDVLELYQPRHLIDKNGNEYANEFTIDDSLTKQTLTKSSIVKAKEIIEQVTLADGSTWIPISVHYIPEGLFPAANISNTKQYVSNNRWTNFDFINTADRPESGYYEFMVCHQTAVNGLFKTYRWKQTVNPFSAAYADVSPSAVGSKVIRISPTSSNSGGMYWFHSSNCQMCFANSSDGNWFGCGISAYWGSTYIPSYNNEQCWGYQLVYMRVKNNKARMTKTGALMPTEIKEI